MTLERTATNYTGSRMKNTNRFCALDLHLMSLHLRLDEKASEDPFSQGFVCGESVNTGFYRVELESFC